MAKTQTPTRGYTATKDQLLARLKRVEGQIRGIGQHLRVADQTIRRVLVERAVTTRPGGRRRVAA